MAYALARFGARYLPRLARYAARAVPRFLRRRRPRRMMRPKKTKNKIHTYVRWCNRDALYPSTNGPSIILSTAADQNLVYSFKLDNLVNPSDFGNLYDCYKINKITVYLERASNDTGDGTNPPANRKMCVVWDDDANALTSEDNYLEYSNCKRYNVIGNGAIKLVLYPKLSVPVLNATATVDAFQSISSSKNWLKIEDDEVPHFGLKMFIPGNVDTVGEELFRVRVKYHLSMKQSK